MFGFAEHTALCMDFIGMLRKYPSDFHLLLGTGTSSTTSLIETLMEMVLRRISFDTYQNLPTLIRFCGHFVSQAAVGVLLSLLPQQYPSNPTSLDQTYLPLLKALPKSVRWPMARPPQPILRAPGVKPFSTSYLTRRMPAYVPPPRHLPKEGYAGIDMTVAPYASFFGSVVFAWVETVLGERPNDYWLAKMKTLSCPQDCDDCNQMAAVMSTTL